MAERRKQNEPTPLQPIKAMQHRNMRRRLMRARAEQSTSAADPDLTARLIADFFGPIIARAERMTGFQAILSRCSSAVSRKELIMAACLSGAIDIEDVELLIQVYQLETA